MLELRKRIHADMKRDMTGIRVEIAAIGQQLGALTSAVYSGKSATLKITVAGMRCDLAHMYSET